MNSKVHQGHKARKRFGQNFLHDDYIIDQIVDAIYPSDDFTMVEIGPGLGALTTPVCDRIAQLHVVELDRDLAARLASHPFLQDKLVIHQADAMKFDFTDLIEPGKKLKIFGNLPYNISTQLMFHLFEFAPYVEDMHFMLQKEVVERITAEVGSKIYGRLSVIMQYYCETEYLLTVPRGAFNPPPKVTSAVFRLRPHLVKPVQAEDEKLFALVVRETFNHRRKTLRAIFKQSSLMPTLDDQDFAKIGIEGNARPETLDVKDFVALSNLVNSKQLTSLDQQ